MVIHAEKKVPQSSDDAANRAELQSAMQQMLHTGKGEAAITTLMQVIDEVVPNLVVYEGHHVIA